MQKTTLCGRDPTLDIAYLDSWQIHELRVAIMRNAPESGVERTKREKEQKKSDSRKVERKVKKIYLKMLKYKQEKKRVTYTKE